MMNPIEIVHGLASSNPVNGSDWICTLCGRQTDIAFGLLGHAPECPWRQAQLYVMSCESGPQAEGEDPERWADRGPGGWTTNEKAVYDLVERKRAEMIDWFVSWAERQR